eukprot:2795464-Amphidinium_carterae.2
MAIRSCRLSLMTRITRSKFMALSSALSSQAALIGLNVNFIISDVSCSIIGSSTMEENSCFALVKPPPFKPWIRDISSNAGSRKVKAGRHYFIHGLIIEGHATSVTVHRKKVKQIIESVSPSHFMKKSQLIRIEEMSLSHSTLLFDDFNTPTAQSSYEPLTSFEAMQPVQVQSPQEPSKAEIELHSLTDMPFRSWGRICVKSRQRRPSQRHTQGKISHS